MSSGITKSRPSASAAACAARYQASAPRVEMPTPIAGWRRVSSTIVHRVVEQRVVDADRLDRVLQRAHGREVDDRLEPRDRIAAGALAEQLALDRLLRVAERDAQQEPVHLRLGQRVRAVVLGRVLRRDHHERPSSWCVASSIETWPSLIASSSADCVRGVVRLISSASTTFAKIGPGLSSNTLPLLVVDRHADDVGRQQVARELDATEGAAERRGERARERRLADARDVLDQQVAARQQRDHRGADRLGLAADDGRDRVLEPADRTDVGRRERRRRRRGRHVDSL